MATVVEDIQINEFSINPFKMHLSDAILAAHISQSARMDTPEGTAAVRSMLSRTAIAHSVFAFESAANCFLARVPRERSFRDQLEMLSAFDKFDTYLLSAPGSPKLPRDTHVVKAMAELVKLRDRHVHPRIMTLPVQRSETASISMNLDMSNNVLDIPPMALTWNTEYAISAIKTVLEFLRLLMGLARLSQEGFRLILSSVANCKDGQREIDPGNFSKILGVAETLGIDIHFLLKTKHN